MLKLPSQNVDLNSVLTYYIVSFRGELFKLFGFYNCDIGLLGKSFNESLSNSLAKAGIVDNKLKGRFNKDIFNERVLDKKYGYYCEFLKLFKGKCTSSLSFITSSTLND